MPINTPSDFFKELYRNAKEGIAEIRLIHKSGEWQKAQKIYRPATDIHNGNFEALKEANEHYHIYHRVNLSLSESSKKADINQIVALWLDIDANDSELEEKLIEHRYPPTMLVYSGGGLHAYWLLREPVIVSTEKERHAIEQTMHGLILDFASPFVDMKTRDITRILRTPFFYNIKDKYAPDYPQARVIWYDEKQSDRYKFSSLYNAYAPLGAPAAPEIRRQIPVIDNGDKPRWVMDYLASGAPSGERNHKLYSVARWYNDNGYSQGDAEQELISRAVMDGLEQSEANQTIRSAYRAPRNALNGLDTTMKKRYALGDKKSSQK